MAEPTFFSADSHVNEPPEAWERIPKSLRAHGPRFVQDPAGKKGLYMVFDGPEPDPVGMTFIAGVDKVPGGVRKVIENFTWEDWRGPWDSVARLQDMDLDGVKIEVLYPRGAAERIRPTANLCHFPRRSRRSVGSGVTQDARQLYVGQRLSPWRLHLA